MENISRQLMDISSSNEVDDFQFRRNVMNAVPAFRPGQFPTWVYLLPDLDTIIEEEEKEDKEEEEQEDREEEEKEDREEEEEEDREEEEQEDTEEEEQEDNPPDTDDMSVFRRNVMNAIPAFRQDRFPTWVSSLPDLDTIIEEEEEEDSEEEVQEDTEEEDQEDREEEEQEDNPPDTDEMSVFRRNVMNAVPAFRQDRFPTWVSSLPDLDTIIEEEEQEDTEEEEEEDTEEEEQEDTEEEDQEDTEEEDQEDREEEEQEDTEEEEQEDNPPDTDEMSVFRRNVINAVPAFRQDRFPTWVSSLPDLDTIIEEEEPDEDAADVIPGLYYLTASEPPTLDTVIEEEDEEDSEEEEEEDKMEEDEEDKEEEDEEDTEEEDEEDREEEEEEDKEEEDEEDREEEEKEGKPPDTEDMSVEEKQQEEQDGAIIPNLMDSATLDTLFANISDCTKLDTLCKNISEWTPDTVLEENKEQRENEKEQNSSEEEIVKPRGWIRRWMRSIFLSLVCCKTSQKKSCDKMMDLEESLMLWTDGVIKK
ncbi:uncharacterized protein LOC143810076 isoform X2 [Ranitomeya variabilis]|uniref:uncharacterized protein LOC143810076 isoform X2 n=1 Tax=Ranitomeya variabilis TaxID=490064 RepID=UPI0040568E18